MADKNLKYVIFVIDGPGNLAIPNEMQHIDAFNEKLQKNGNWITAAGIHGADRSFVIDNRNNKNELIPGSLVTTIENYSGFWLIIADNLDTAQKIALEGSLACNRRVELRPFIQ